MWRVAGMRMRSLMSKRALRTALMKIPKTLLLLSLSSN